MKPGSIVTSIDARAWLLLVVLVGCSRASAVVPPPKQLPTSGKTSEAAWPPVFVDIAGKEHRPAEETGVKAIGLIFVLPDCPIANSLIPEINRLREAFQPRGVRLLLVRAEADVTAEKAREHAKEYEVGPPIVLDPEHEWVKKAGAKVSPEAVVFSAVGEIVYRGRINDQYVGLGKRRGVVTTHDLREALEAVLDGRPVAQPRTEAVGC